MQRAVPRSPAKIRQRKTLPVLLLGAFLLLLGVVALFSIGASAAKFDAAYDAGTDLSKFIFRKLGEGESYTFLERFWLLVARCRVALMIAGVALAGVYVLFNREMLYSQTIAPFVFILPFLVTFAVFFIYPLLSTILMSFQSITGGGTSWIGVKNYVDMFNNKTFFIAVSNSVRYMVFTCALLIPFPLLFAYMINAQSMKCSGLFKALYYMPVLCSVVVAGIIFRMMFSELPGSMMNQLRATFGLEPMKWLKDYNGSMFALVLLCCWRWTGMNMLYYMAGLKSIPGTLYEAADIDGANAVQKFLHIGWPLLKPTTIYVLTISIYAGLAMFTESYMVFGHNNSPKNYGLTIVGYLYRYGFEKVDKFGFASAVGLVLLVGAMIINIAQLYVTGVIGGKKRLGGVAK